MPLTLRFALGCSALLWVACASNIPAGAPRSVPPPAEGAGKVEPGDAVERAVLTKLDSMPAGKAVKVGGGSATAGARYAAASGRNCRSVQLSRGAGGEVRRLACHDGSRWFYVPDVFRGPVKGSTK